MLGKGSVIDGMTFIPLIRPEQLASYEAFIPGYYATDPFFDPVSFNSPVMPEGQVWSLDFSTVPSTPYHDTTGETTYGSPNKILTPATQYTFSSLVSPGSGNFNIHSIETYGLAIDSVIECVAATNYSYALTSCGGISGAITLPLPDPVKPAQVTDDVVSLFVHPILPAQNQTELVGFAAGILSWKTLLSDMFPAYVRPFDIVVETGSETFTFTTEQGVAKFKGYGDGHDREYDEYAVTSELHSHTAQVASSPNFTITIYPTNAFATKFFTDHPQQASLRLLLVFVYCAALFLAYDILVRRESGEHAAVLDTKRRFVRFISHEIRTPLNTVRLGMKLLEVELAKLLTLIVTAPAETLLDVVSRSVTSWQSLADDIMLNSETAVEVLNDLLNYDKIEMGTLRLEFTLVNVCTLLSKTIAIMQVQAEQKNIKLELTPTAAELISDGRAMIVGDKLRIEQVVRSLISNALRFTPSDGVVTVSGTSVLNPVLTSIRCFTNSLPVYLLIVRTTRSTKFSPPKQALDAVGINSQSPLSHGTIVIAVKDSGAGLSEEEVAKITAHGIHFNVSELQAGQGSGLGLFISKGIIEQHGGKLVVTSDGLGKGVTFSAVLPYYGEEVIIKRQQQPSDQTIRASTRSMPSEPRRMLVVDDSPFNRKMLIRLLSSKDHKCEQAENGEAAVWKYLEMVERGEPPDAILMDFEMPVMNGPSATARLRELGCACLIVGVTGNVLPHDVAFFLEHGADAVLPKPLILEEFEQLLYSRKVPMSPADESSGFPPMRVSVKDAPSPNMRTIKVLPLENV
jgi:signal transduction histidine kinase/ActR/RegA family two-component response regulator